MNGEQNEPGQSSQYQPVATRVHPSLDEVTEMINRVMTIQGQQQQQQQEANMKMFKDLLESKGMRTPEKEWSTAYKPPRQHENRIEAKSFSRMSQFVGGETDYKEWSFDIETTVESVCPGFNAMLQTYMAGAEAGKVPEY